MPRPKKIIHYILTLILGLIVSAGILVIYLYNNPEFLSSLDPSSTFEITMAEPELSPDSLRRLRLDNIFWTHRIELAQDKTIDLLLDLPARQILMEIQGVTVYSAPIVYYNPNDSLLALSRSDHITSWLEVPFLLESEQASIAKEPIQVKEIQVGASQDDDHMTRFRDPEKEEEVIINFFFNQRLTITLRQIEYMPGENSSAVRLPEPSEYYLEIFLDQEAAKTIYRAVSVGQTGLALRPE